MTYAVMPPVPSLSAIFDKKATFMGLFYQYDALEDEVPMGEGKLC